MTALFISPREDPEPWRAAFARLAPDIFFRAWPEPGPPEEVEYILAWKPPAEALAGHPNLRVLFWLGAGIDWLLDHRDRLPAVPVVRLVDDALTACMTEYVVLHVLRHHRRQPELERQQSQALWRPLPQTVPWKRSVGIMGLGVLGTDAARKLRALRFRLAGWSRTPKALPGVECFHGADGLVPFLARTEILVCLLPLTPETRGIINARTLSALPRGATLINAARGGHVVEADLLAALDTGHITHATLDVFEPEPLPPGHPFWRHPRVTVTPHVASLTDPEVSLPVIVDNIRRHQRGEPMLNQVDLDRGY
ncbi:MAG: glyoxylate/hydroxypyruvate reductase A [Rhodospirillaceae bacterium]|nr:glyoxylate/hydroxypyruvate reductase A [Rhodospirillaceae bacterium]